MAAKRIKWIIVLFAVLELGGALLLSILLAGPAFAESPQAMDEVATFTLRETFGVQHPDQIVTFDLSTSVAPANCYLVGPTGVEVPYQVLGGGKQIAVRTGLPASRLLMRRGLGDTGQSLARSWNFDAAGVEKCLSIDGPFVTPGNVVQVDSEAAGRAVAGHKLLCEQGGVPRLARLGFLFVGLSATPGGPPIPITRAGENAGLFFQALVADPATSQLYVHAHGLSDGIRSVFVTAASCRNRCSGE